MARKEHGRSCCRTSTTSGRAATSSRQVGYLRNYLVPRRVAEQATDARINEIKQTESVRAKQQARTTEQAQRSRAR